VGKHNLGFRYRQDNFEADFAQIFNNFSDIPVVVGEWQVSPVHSEPAGRWRYVDFLARMAKKYGFSTMVWDTGNDCLDRTSHTWRDPTAIAIYLAVLKGDSNSLPDSTVDPQAATQYSSAFIFHKVGDLVTDYVLPFQLNGNSVASITDGFSPLTEWVQYYTDGDNIVITEAYLSSQLSRDLTPGVLANLTIEFSAGAPIPVSLVQWQPPTLPTASSQAIDGSSLFIPVDWKGVRGPATVGAYRSDGTYLVDDWTVYLGPIQHCRMTYGAQWTWNCKYLVTWLVGAFLPNSSSPLVIYSHMLQSI
jgi:endoglucanase